MTMTLKISVTSRHEDKVEKVTASCRTKTAGGSRTSTERHHSRVATFVSIKLSNGVEPLKMGVEKNSENRPAVTIEQLKAVLPLLKTKVSQDPMLSTKNLDDDFLIRFLRAREDVHKTIVLIKGYFKIRSS